MAQPDTRCSCGQSPSAALGGEGPTLGILGIEAGGRGGEERIEQVDVGQADGAVQGCTTLAVHQGSICASLQQARNQWGPPPHGRQVQRGQPVQALHIHLRPRLAPAHT